MSVAQTPVAQTPIGRQLRQVPRVLSIAGTDPTGGAGIHADLKSIGANGGYGMAVVTALVAQNTQGVRSVHTPPVEFLREQLDAVGDDVEIDAVKIGMLGDVQVIETVRGWLLRARPAVVVLDPVMVATSGDRLLEPAAEEALRALLPLAHLVTPNLPELAVLVNEPVAHSWPEALEQGRRLSRESGVTVLVKGGHLRTAESPDALVNAHGLLGEEVLEFSAPRVDTRNTHGTGCSLSSAMATVQARTGDWAHSLDEVKAWLQGALEHADELEVGRGNGPIHHFHRFHRAAPGEAGIGGTDEFSRGLWDHTAEVREAIYGLDFIRSLGDGTLSTEQFAYYLTQDALYLNGFSRVLARTSALAPTEEEQLFWARGAATSLEVESELHRTWLARHGAGVGADIDADGQPATIADAQPATNAAGQPATAGPVTKQYLDHLLACSSTGSYAVLVAAVLPCYWIYAHVGETLHARYRRGSGPHPYAAWLETYANEAFAAATGIAIGFLDRAAGAATASERERMRRAFADSSHYELLFFDAPTHRA